MALCDNAYTKGSGRGISVSPQCYNGKVTTIARVIYDKYGTDSEDLYLCAECVKALKTDARKYGYSVQTRKG